MRSFVSRNLYDRRLTLYSICRLDPDVPVCEGCFRTIDEIAAWGRMTDEQKWHVWENIGQRKLAGQAGQAGVSTDQKPA